MEANTLQRSGTLPLEEKREVVVISNEMHA